MYIHKPHTPIYEDFYGCKKNLGKYFSVQVYLIGPKLS